MTHVALHNGDGNGNSVPTGWKTISVSELCYLQRGFDITESTRKRGSVPVYSSSGISYYHSEAKVLPPGVITGRKGLLGKVFFVDEPFWPHDTTLWATDFFGNHPAFVALALEAFHLERLDAATSVPTLNRNNLTGYFVSIPSDRAEQEAIAEALGDADALIESLEQLVAKKRHLKQAAMQQLLTGKKRLPGFEGEWKRKRLPDICWFQEGPGVRNKQFTTSGVKLLNGTNIFRGALDLDTTTRFIAHKEAHGPYAHFLADAGDIVIASSGITIDRFHEKVAYVRDADLPFCMNTSTIRFKPKSDSLSDDYLFQFLCSGDFKEAIGGQATGSAQLNFGPSHLAKVDLPTPPLAEQTAIAQVLTDMDTEIEAIEAKLAKARQIKQGMMHELLTGRTRLV
jgi:type I restriction enzyme, S subunit